MNLKKRAALFLAFLGGAMGPMIGGSARAAGGDTHVSQADKQFLDDAYSVNEGEIMLGHLAEQRGTTRAVTDFAKRMVGDHTKSLDASKRVANEAKVKQPTSVDAQTKALYGDLSQKNGRDFDTAYLDAMVTGHEAAVREFNQEASGGENPAVKSYARDELPMLRQHLSMARKAQGEEQKGVTEPQKR